MQLKKIEKVIEAFLKSKRKNNIEMNTTSEKTAMLERNFDKKSIKILYFLIYL